MKNNIILLISFILASGSALAETSMLEAAGKQMVADKAAAAVPGTTEKVGAASEAVDSANTLKSATEAAPAALTDQTKETAEGAAKEQVKTAVPAEAAKAVDTAKSGKAAIGAAPKSTSEAADTVKGKAAGKALDLLK